MSALASSRLLHHHRAATVAGGLLLASLLAPDPDGGRSHPRGPRVRCQAAGPAPQPQRTRTAPPEAEPAPSSVSAVRRVLYRLHLARLPLPRRLQPQDPDLTLAPRLARRRARDEAAARRLQSQVLEAIRARDEARLAELLRQTYAVLYGPPPAVAAGSGDTAATCYAPQDRQDFLQRYGCTGYTEEVLLALCALARDRGIVEIGAGQGQWARALTERHRSLVAAASATTRQGHGNNKKPFDFVLAYDDCSALPLNPEIYHKKTLAHQKYFFDKVQDCRGTTLDTLLASWPCRGRVLLLVYPHQNDMAVDAVRAYSRADPTRNDTVVYAGEGRGGVNANDAFFDYLESGDWMLEQMLPLHVFGTKGYERLYIFRRRQA